MKRLALLLVPLVAFAALASAEAAKKPRPFKMVICHKTSSTARPYVRIVVTSRAQLRAHTATHHADIVPAPAGGCPQTVLTPGRGGVALTATLTGVAEVPPADLDGMGTATIRLRPGQGQICFVLSVTNVEGPYTAAHIHVGTVGQVGPPVVTLTTPDATGTSRGCVAASRSLVLQILQNPGGYYVNVHTQQFPDGAVRGQLSR
jgi:hypothetical protein